MMQNSGAGVTIPATPAPNGSNDEPRRSRKPANTKFKQQQLPAWQPMLTARSVLPFLIAVGLAFIPIGIALYLSANGVTEVKVDYTDCSDIHSQIPCSNITTEEGLTCTCKEGFTLSKAIAGPIFVYYGLDNFYQNHRKYVKSRDDNQLMGTLTPNASTDCDPFRVSNTGQNIAPCGAVANSLFNDVIGLKFTGTKEDPKDVPVPLLRTEIAWNSDRTVKFRNPKLENGKTLEEVWKANNLIKPKLWKKQPWELDLEIPENNGLQNEDFIVWMRTAAFPSFRKLYRRVNHTVASFENGLAAGNYTLDITYNFPVTAFEGRKYVIISSVSWIGGRNIFLGVAYMTVGSCCLVLAVIFFVIHLQWGKSGGLTSKDRFVRKDAGFSFRPSGTVFAEPDTPGSSPQSSYRGLQSIQSVSQFSQNSQNSLQPKDYNGSYEPPENSTRENGSHLTGSSSATNIPRERSRSRYAVQKSTAAVTTRFRENIGDSVTAKNSQPNAAVESCKKTVHDFVGECNEVYPTEERLVSQIMIRRRPVGDLPVLVELY